MADFGEELVNNVCTLTSSLDSLTIISTFFRVSDEKSVRLSVRQSVCLSIKRVHCDKTEERSVHIFIPYERSFSLVFLEEWLVGGDHFYLKFWVNRPPLVRNRRFRTDNSS